MLQGASGVVVPLPFPSAGFVYPSAPRSRWIDPRPSGAQTQECRHRLANRVRRRRGWPRRPRSRRHGDPEDNAYFRRSYCLDELRWAREAGVPIQPVVWAQDKARIGEFVWQAPGDLQHLMSVDIIHLDRSRAAYWKVSVSEVLSGMENLAAHEGEACLPAVL